MAGKVLQWDQLTSLFVCATLSCSRERGITAECWGNAMGYQALAEPYGVLVPILAMGVAFRAIVVVGHGSRGAL